MPVSLWLGMEDALQAIVERRPASVLDAGVGFGLWGMLLRQYLDVWSGRIQREQWTMRIDGIEIDERRVQAHHRHLYTDVLIGDVRTLLPRRAAEQRYDVILLGDVVEHLPKADGRALIGAAIEHAGKLVVVRIPLGDGWRREGREEPDHHRAQWYIGDFDSYPCTIRQYDFVGNPYALVTIEAGPAERDAPTTSLSALDHRLKSIETRLERLVSG